MEKEYIKGKVIWDDVNNCGMIKGTKLDTNLFPTIKKENINEYVDILYETYKPYKTEYINGIKDKNGKDIQKINPINNGNHTNRNRQHTNQTQTQNNNGARDNRPQNNGNRRNEKPTAPYNFIPLNEKIVPSPWNDESQIPHLLQHRANLLSGYLDITLENLSDFFIGNTTHFEDDKQKKQCHGIKDKYGNPIIMGSSIRGMIKNLMEIMAYSKISNVNNDTLYYKQNRKKQIYLKSTLDHIKNENEVALDMTQALFGEMGKFSTRLNLLVNY